MLIWGIVLASAFVLDKTRKASRDALTIGSVKALHAALVSELREGNRDLEEVFRSAEAKWRVLSASDYDKTIAILDKKKYPLDAAPSRPLVDLWGNRFVISYRKLPDGNYDFIVVSNGRDGSYGTADDVVSVWGKSAPPVLLEQQTNEQKE